MAEFLGKYTCYVNQPSSCSDLVPSKSNPGEMVSMIPCEKENQEGTKVLSFLIEPLKILYIIDNIILLIITTTI